MLGNLCGLKSFIGQDFILIKMQEEGSELVCVCKGGARYMSVSDDVINDSYCRL